MDEGPEPRPDPGAIEASRPGSEHDATVASMLRAARAVLRSEDLAWDVVQETLLRAWTEGRRLSPGTLCRRTVHAALHVRRGQARRGFHEARASRTEGGAEDPWSSLARGELVARVRARLASLHPRQRRVLELYVAHGSYRLVARVLDIPIGTVRSRLARVRRVLRDARLGPR